MLEAERSLHNRLEKGDFQSLSPFKDEKGIIRVGGRVSKAVVSYNSQHPILLPCEYWILLLITRQPHQSMNLQSRSNSIVCSVVRLAYKVESQLMSDLPQLCLAPSTPPFHYTLCDYFGPYTVKIGSNKTTKCYGVLFKCLYARGNRLWLFHFRVSTSSSKIPRNSRSTCYNDEWQQNSVCRCRTRTMRNENRLKNEELREFCADKGMEWRFTTPAAPHHNGCAEALVKSCKKVLKTAVGN